MSNKEYRICHLTNLTQMGGVEKMLLELLNSDVVKKNNRYKHFVASTSASEEVLDHYKESGIDVFIPYRSFHYDPFAIISLSRWLRLQEIDVIHTYNNVSNTWGMLSGLLAGVDYKITSEHGTAWDTKGWRYHLEKFFLKFADKNLANSTASKEILKSKYGIEDGKITVVNNGVKFTDDEFNQNNKRSEFGLNEKDILIGTVGRIDYPKYHQLFINLAEVSKKENLNFKYMIVGDGPLLSDLKHEADKRGVADSIIFTGWRNDAKSIMKLFDIYLSTSYRESFGNSLVEAAYQKKPIIAPQIDGIVDIFEDSEHAVLLEPTESFTGKNIPNSKIPEWTYSNLILREPKLLNCKDVFNAIQELVENKEWREKMSENAYQRVKTKFSINSYYDRLEYTYRIFSDS